MQTEARKFDGIQRGNKLEAEIRGSWCHWSRVQTGRDNLSDEDSLLVLLHHFFLSMRLFYVSFSYFSFRSQICLAAFPVYSSLGMLVWTVLAGSSIHKQPEIFKSGAVLDRAEQIVAPIFG